MSVKRHVKVGAKRKAAVNRRVASALAGFLRKMNPGTKAAGAKVQRLKGGVIKITPMKRNAGGTGESKKVRALNAVMRAKTAASRERALRALDKLRGRR